MTHFTLGEPSYCEPPVTPGHEFSGHVVALGPGAEEHHGVKEGNSHNVLILFTGIKKLR